MFLAYFLKIQKIFIMVQNGSLILIEIKVPSWPIDQYSASFRNLTNLTQMADYVDSKHSGQTLVSLSRFQSYVFPKVQKFEEDTVPEGWNRDSVNLEFAFSSFYFFIFEFYFFLIFCFLFPLLTFFTSQPYRHPTIWSIDVESFSNAHKKILSRQLSIRLF